MFAPKLLLRLEGAAALISASLFYFETRGAWLLFVLLFLAPDLFMLGYLLNRQLGARVYNLVHTYTAPLLLLCFGYLTRQNTCSWIALIWLAHVGMDRLFGFGLKYESAFKDTHLQRV